jgi:hypothetical protein
MLVRLASSGGAGDKFPDQFGNVRGIEQRGFDEDAGAERVVLRSGVDDVPVQR